MTTCYQWFSFPSEFCVECPKCRALAKCVKAPGVLPPRRGRAIAGKAIEGAGILKGDISCLGCGWSGSATIHWPSDAYWKCQVKGKTLWAWSFEHAEHLLKYIQAWDRREPCPSLLHLPSHFKLAKNRRAAVASLKRMMAGRNRQAVAR